MFTGIVEELGTVVAVEPRDDAARLTVAGAVVTGDAGPGDSIAVDGVCLTVAALGPGRFEADVMGETLRRTTLGERRPGDRVNLERAVTPATRLGGHLVQGHVDGTARLLARDNRTHWEVVRIEAPAELERYLAMKGSVAVDGTSLTVSGLGAGWFEVSLIPTTLAATTLGGRRPGERVNLEVDVVAKYVERLLEGRSA